MDQALRVFDMKTGKKSQLGGVIVGAIFIAFSFLVLFGIVNLEFLQEAWRNSVLINIVPTKNTAFIYTIIGILMTISSILPDKYSEAKVYNDKIEFIGKKGMIESYNFKDVSSIKIQQTSKGSAKNLEIILKNSNKKIQISNSYKSELPDFVLLTWQKYSSSNS